MCLNVDLDREIWDDRLYTFYKVYGISVFGGGYVTPHFNSPIPKDGKLVARTRLGDVLPEGGREAYNMYAEVVCTATQVEFVNEGIHAYETREVAELRWGTLLVGGYEGTLSIGSYKLFEIEVLGKHIMAFGEDGDVAFTRGQLVLR